MRPIALFDQQAKPFDAVLGAQIGTDADRAGREVLCKAVSDLSAEGVVFNVELKIHVLASAF